MALVWHTPTKFLPARVLGRSPDKAPSLWRGFFVGRYSSPLCCLTGRVKKSLLVVEDDETLRRGLEHSLSLHGYVVDVCSDGLQALEQLQQTDYAAMVLDLGLPQMDGMEVLRRTRVAGKKLPCLILTARDTPEDCVAGLDGGADDYLVKPFHLAELLARLRALLRRVPEGDERIARGDLTLEPVAGLVFLHGQEIALTAAESALLAVLLRRSQTVIPRAALEAVLPSRAQGASNSLDVLVHRLRKKLGAERIQTVHGVGYRLSFPDGSSD